MPDRLIVTPFFLDKPQPELESLARPDGFVNRPPLPEGGIPARLAILHRPIVSFVAETLSRGERPVSIAGDCLAAIPALAGLQRAGLEPSLLWLDAHGDFNTPETSPSGFLGGMPLAMLAGRGEQSLMKASRLRPLVEERIVLCDGRDLDPGEARALAASKVRRIANPANLAGVFDAAATLHVHIDADIVDPAEAPAMAYPAKGGPSAAELREALRALAGAARIVSISLSTWDPSLDRDGRTQTVCLSLLRALTEP
jgi:arginase